MTSSNRNYIDCDRGSDNSAEAPLSRADPTPEPGIARVLSFRSRTPYTGRANRSPSDMTLVNPTSETDLLSALQRYWGYSTFRPLQESIVGSLLGGHDT